MGNQESNSKKCQPNRPKGDPEDKINIEKSEQKNAMQLKSNQNNSSVNYIQIKEQKKEIQLKSNQNNQNQITNQKYSETKVIQNQIDRLPEIKLSNRKSSKQYIEPKYKDILMKSNQVPVLYRNRQYILDESKGIYFNLGHNNVYTDELHELFQINPKQPNDKTKSLWISVPQRDYIFESTIDIQKKLQLTYRDVTELRLIGSFILCKHKWGFILNFSKIQQIYQGKINKPLQSAFKHKFIQDLFKKYAYYILEDKQLTIRDLKSTQNDQRLSEEELKNAQTLFPHQKQEVGWMLDLERNPEYMYQNTDLIPLLDSGYYFNPFQKELKIYNAKQAKSKKNIIKLKGGILASDVGSGKTASCLYLIKLSKLFNKKNDQLSTLIITPNSITYQWRQEITKFVPELSVLHLIDIKDIKDFKKQDIVLISRQTLEKDLKYIIADYKFKRVIADQIHEIMKLMQKKGTKSYYNHFFESVKASVIWGVTGTPDNVDYHSNLQTIAHITKFPKQFYDQNNLNLFRQCFLQMCIRKNTNEKNLQPVIKQKIYSRMQALDSILYRGKVSYNLEQQEIRKICYNILPDYELVENNTVQKGISIINNQLHYQIENQKQKLQYASKEQKKKIQQKIQRLSNQNSFYKQIISVLESPTFECIICLQDLPTTKLVLTECLHYTCDQCYNALFKQLIETSCPFCKSRLGKGKYIIHPQMSGSENKIQLILKQIKKVPNGEKIIIFTQFHNLVERLALDFVKLDIPFLELMGVPSEINYRLKTFRNSPHINIILLSIEQAASGINLTQANHVFFAHPIIGSDFNLLVATYRQCIGRVNRIGQKKTVYVKMFVSEGTVEEHYQNHINKA